MSAFDKMRNLNSVYEQATANQMFSSAVQAAMEPAITANQVYSSALQVAMEPAITANQVYSSALQVAMEPAITANQVYSSALQVAMEPAINANQVYSSALQVAMEPAINGDSSLSSAIPTKVSHNKKKFNPHTDSEFKENINPDLSDKRNSIEPSKIEEKNTLEEKVQGGTPTPKGSLNNPSSNKPNWFREKLKTMKYLIPIKYREEVLGDFLETRSTLKLDGHSKLWVNIMSFLQISTIAWSMIRVKVSDHVNPSQDTNGDS